MVFQGRMNRKIYKVIMWVLVTLIIFSFLFTIVVPLVAAPLPSDAPPTAASSPAPKTLLTTLAGWLVQPWVSWFLIAVGMSGLALEVFALTWGRPGTTGVISLVLFFLGSFLSGTADVWAVVLFVLGVLLIASEILIFPGRLAAGLSGAVLLSAAVALASPSTLLAVVYLVLGFLVTVFVLLSAFKIIDLEAIWEWIRHRRSSNRSVN